MAYECFIIYTQISELCVSIEPRPSVRPLISFFNRFTLDPGLFLFTFSEYPFRLPLT